VVTSADDATVALVVENTGAVISPERVATLTEPFQRGSERARTGDHAGVGLGLAIVRSITEAHGGTLVLAARAQGGLRATVRLGAQHP
jgi:two-component system sensor histidine kinase VanS